MSSIGTVGVRVIPNLSGFGASVSAAVAGSGSVMARSGAAAGLLISAPIVATVAKGISEAVSFESALAGVAKTVDAPKSVIDKIGQDARDSAKEMPFLREEILGVYEAAGRFGVDPARISEVGDMFLKLGTAIPELAPEQAAQEMTKLFNVMKTPPDQWEKGLSTIVALGNDLPTTEQQIISFGQRLTQAKAVAGGLNEADILGLAAGFSALGVKPQAGGTAVSRVFFKMNDAIAAGGDTLKGFTDMMGVTNDEFTQLFQTDPERLFLDFLGAVNKMDPSKVPSFLKDMGLGEIRVRDAILRGAQGLDTLEGASSLANESFSEGTALQEEYDKRLETTASQWQIFKNKASDAALTLGTALLPILLDVMDVLEPFIEFLGLAAEWFAELPEPIRLTAAFLGTLLAVVGPLVFILSKVAPMITAIRGALALLAASPVMLILLAIALVALLIIMHWDTLKQWFFAFWEWFYTNWDKLWAWFFEKLGELEQWWEETWTNIAEFFYNKYLTLKGWFDSVINKIIEIGLWILDLPNKFATAWDWIIEKTRAAKDILLQIMGEIGAAADRALGPIDEIIGFGLKAGGGLLSAGANWVRGMDNGGIVPGPIGAPRMILAHGGEEVSPRHKEKTADGGINITIGKVVMANDMDVVRTGRELARETQRELRAAGL